MKKLKLKAFELGANEVLTRAQLKNVLGGDGGDGALSCRTGCSVGVGSVIDGTWRVNTGTCALKTNIGPGGATLTYCSCSILGGTTVVGCGNPTTTPTPPPIPD